MENRKNADELLAERFGERGSTEREQFKEQAFSYYFDEKSSKCRKDLSISQDRLVEMVGNKTVLNF